MMLVISVVQILYAAECGILYPKLEVISRERGPKNTLLVTSILYAHYVALNYICYPNSECLFRLRGCKNMDIPLNEVRWNLKYNLHIKVLGLENILHEGYFPIWAYCCWI